MITVEVIRGAGDADGGEILEPLLGDSLEAALARGRAELDQHAHGHDRVAVITTTYRPELLLGVRLAVADPDLGAVWYGTVVGVEHLWDGTLAETRLTIDRARAEAP
jgi:hypothetical protein